MPYTRPSDWFPLFNKHDPLGFIRAGAPKDEYYDEIGKIQDSAAECKSVDELQDLVFSVFFELNGGGDSGQDFVGTRDKYRALAEDIWHVLRAS